MLEDIVRRLEGALGRPGLVEQLAAELSASDLQSLLMAVYDRRARDRTPAEVLHDYQNNRFTRPSAQDPRAFVVVDQIAHRLLAAAAFRVLDLSPLSPWGACSALGPVSQNKVISALRGEVSSDPTNTLALEAVLVRRKMLAVDPRDANPVRLAAHQRVTRVQPLLDASHFAHFRVYCLVSAGRDTGDRNFERNALVEHLRFHVALILETTGVEPDSVRIALTPFDEVAFGDRLEQWIPCELRSALPSGIRVELDRERKAGRGYYDGFCFKIHVERPGHGFLELSDGGCVGWTQKLLSSRKERCLISGTGVERVALMMEERSGG